MASRAAIVASIGAALLSGPATANEGDVTVLEGSCEYGGTAVLGNRPWNAGLAVCRTVRIEQHASGAGSIAYVRALGRVEIRYEGRFDGRKMAIERLRIGDDESLNATGECTIYYSDERISTVTCIGQVGSNTYAGNFRASRVNSAR